MDEKKKPGSKMKNKIKEYQQKNTEKKKEKKNGEAREISIGHQKWILALLKNNKRSCTYHEIVEEGEKYHCDTVGAMLKILKKRKAIEFEGAFLMYPTHKDVVITLKNENFDPATHKSKKKKRSQPSTPTKKEKIPKKKTPVAEKKQKEPLDVVEESEKVNQVVEEENQMVEEEKEVKKPRPSWMKSSNQMFMGFDANAKRIPKRKTQTDGKPLIHSNSSLGTRESKNSSSVAVNNYQVEKLEEELKEVKSDYAKLKKSHISVLSRLVDVEEQNEKFMSYFKRINGYLKDIQSDVEDNKSRVVAVYKKVKTISEKTSPPPPLVVSSPLTSPVPSPVTPDIVTPTTRPSASSSEKLEIKKPILNPVPVAVQGPTFPASPKKQRLLIYASLEFLRLSFLGIFKAFPEMNKVQNGIINGTKDYYLAKGKKGREKCVENLNIMCSKMEDFEFSKHELENQHDAMIFFLRLLIYIKSNFKYFHEGYSSKFEDIKYEGCPNNKNHNIFTKVRNCDYYTITRPTSVTDNLFDFIKLITTCQSCSTETLREIHLPKYLLFSVPKSHAESLRINSIIRIGNISYGLYGVLATDGNQPICYSIYKMKWHLFSGGKSPYPFKQDQKDKKVFIVGKGKIATGLFYQRINEVFVIKSKLLQTKPTNLDKSSINYKLTTATIKYFLSTFTKEELNTNHTRNEFKKLLNEMVRAKYKEEYIEKIQNYLLRLNKDSKDILRWITAIIRKVNLNHYKYRSGSEENLIVHTYNIHKYKNIGGFLKEREIAIDSRISQFFLMQYKNKKKPKKILKIWKIKDDIFTINSVVTAQNGVSYNVYTWNSTGFFEISSSLGVDEVLEKNILRDKILILVFEKRKELTRNELRRLRE